MSDEWLIAYRLYSEAELTAEIARLKSWAQNPFNAQTEGQRSYARSTSEIRDRLAAALTVQAENSSTTPRHGIADFSSVQV
jgi:hypothetical protein